jgi:dienelactone hydrolase
MSSSIHSCVLLGISRAAADYHTQSPPTMNAFLSTLRVNEVEIPSPRAVLHGELSIPVGATGLVIFAHGSGSSRLSPRNRLVATELHRKKLATLLFDLLTPREAIAEAHTGELRFNIPMLTERLVSVTRWAQQEESVKGLGIGYFGASTGAAAALVAASQIPEVQAVVSRGGRSDLAGDAIDLVKAATLLIVGDLDSAVIDWNQESLERLNAVKHLAIIADATHLFAEPGALEEVAELAASWFENHLKPIKQEGN